VNSFGFVVIIAIISTALIISILSDLPLDVKNKDELIRSAESHSNQAHIYEQQAQDLSKKGEHEEALKKFVLAAKEYHQAAMDYGQLNDFFNAAKYHGRSSLAYEEAHIIQTESHIVFRP